MIVILDTNFLMIPGEFHVDIFEELDRLFNVIYHTYIFEGTIQELERLALGNTKDKDAAQVALELIKQKNLKTLENSSSLVDDMIVEEIRRNPREYVVCTQDKALKQRVKDEGSRVITLRSKKYLDYEV